MYGNVKELLTKSVNLKQLLGLLESEEDGGENSEIRPRTSSHTDHGTNYSKAETHLTLILNSI